MAQISIFGSGAVVGGIDDPDHPDITVGTRFRVSGATGGTVDGLKIYVRQTTGDHYFSTYGYLSQTNGTVLAVKPLAATLTPNTWNQALFDTPYSLGDTSSSPVDLVVAVYLPGGGYAAVAHTFDSDVASVDDPAHLIAPGGATPNGVFDQTTQTTPATPTFGTFGSFNQTFYSVDPLVTLTGTAASTPLRVMRSNLRFG